MIAPRGSPLRLLASTLATGLSLAFCPISVSATSYQDTLRFAPDAAAAPLTIDSFAAPRRVRTDPPAAVAPPAAPQRPAALVHPPTHRVPRVAHVTAPKLRRTHHGEDPALARLARHGFSGTLRITSSILHMVATAYTAHCYGCSGRTALGYRAGHGIVAVDPRVIPLGTHLYIPGYGLAVAGDTGGDIKGHRIDLGFEGRSEALRFGRRPIAVYILSSLAAR